MNPNKNTQFVVSLVFCAISTSATAADILAGDALKKHISGKRVYLSAAVGEFPMTYHHNGVVDGSGEALGLGKLLAPKDKGRWWISGENLCQKWEQWYDGKTFCFTVRPTGEKTIAWVRDDGYSGTARIAD